MARQTAPTTPDPSLAPDLFATAAARLKNHAGPGAWPSMTHTGYVLRRHIIAGAARSRITPDYYLPELPPGKKVGFEGSGIGGMMGVIGLEDGDGMPLPELPSSRKRACAGRGE
jgi:hypothetical protein